MRPSRSLAAGVAVWVLVVALGSALVWVVIARAGDGVVSSDAPVTTTTDRPDQLDESNPSRIPGPSTTPSSAPTSRAGQTTTENVVRRTWQGVGGQVTVECRGAAASFVNALPDNGFHSEIDDRGPERVRVEFEAEEDARSRIEATCVDGVPVFEPEIDSE